MRLVPTIEIHGGGAGSGCHGENCGRPAGHGADILHEKIGGQKGSNPGGLYRGSDGVERYVKFYKNPAQGRGEALANTIYNDLGIGAPKSTMFKTPEGKEAFASEIVPNGKATLERSQNKAKYADKILDGLAADILVGNWDVLGLTLDNILIDKNDNVHRIDSGGTFLYRAQGLPKPEGLLNKITEYDAYFNPSVNREFSNYMKSAGYKSADDIKPRLKEQVSKIDKLQKAAGGWDSYVKEKAPYVQGAERTKIAGMLDARLKLLKEKVGL